MTAPRVATRSYQAEDPNVSGEVVELANPVPAQEPSPPDLEKEEPEEGDLVTKRGGTAEGGGLAMCVGVLLMPYLWHQFSVSGHNADGDFRRRAAIPPRPPTLNVGSISGSANARNCRINSEAIPVRPQH